MEEFNSIEIVREDQVIEALDSKGIEDVEVKKLFEKYVDQCSAQADLEARSDPSPETSNRANIKSQIKIGILLSKTMKYKNEALESFYDVLNAANQNESTGDLANEIRKLIESL